jgi:hypothetical protein
VTLTIDLTVLLVLLNIVALGYLSWRYGPALTRLVYAIRARRLHAEMERALRCKIVRIVGHVNDVMVDGWIAAVRGVAKSGQELHLLVHSNGGDSGAAIRLKNAIVDHPHDVVAHVPNHAWSAGTSIVLVCDRIVMGLDSTLGPVDRAWKRDQPDTFAIEELQAHDAGVSVAVIKARSCADEAAADLLNFRVRRRAMQYRIHPNQRLRRAADVAAVDENLVKMLVRGCWGHHWRAIFRADARGLGLDVVDAQTKAGEDFAELARLTHLSLPEDQR